jgi:hypothetical protein
MQTNVVTVVAASDAVKVPSVTVIGLPAVRLALDDVTYGVHDAGVVPPEMVVGTSTGAALLLMATTTTVPFVPVNAESRRLGLEFPKTSTMT